MDTTKRRRRIQKAIISDSISDIYSHDLNMYLEPPSFEIQLNEFEDIALERLQLLRIIEQATLKGHKPYSNDWHDFVKEYLIKANLKKYVLLMSGYGTHTEQHYQARRADHLSHFILRIAYCRSEDLRRWILSRELEWFRLRFGQQKQQSIKSFLTLYNFDYTPISNTEKTDVKDELLATTYNLSEENFERTEIYKVPFEEIVSLVAGRKIFLKNGMGYISFNNLIVCIQSKFRSHLSQSLNIFYRKLSQFDDGRVDFLLSNLHNVHTGATYTAPADQNAIDPNQLDALAKRNFPLCMQTMHHTLRATHHLRHFARLQYGLFLKAIGLLYEDALRFWRDEFLKTMDLKKFDREHAYNIGHMYGKVGKRQSYSPYSCIKIIMASVGPGDNHGCPFKHWDTQSMKKKLADNGLGSDAIDEILDLMKGGHCQLACGKYYETVHYQAPVNAINHPNQYFEESMKADKNNKTT